MNRDLPKASAPRTVADGHAGTSAEKPADGSARKVSNRRFDAAKVAKLREEIASGRYEIDPFSVADRFIEHERNGA